eukprot:4509537-Ditylum_brightwellii.AAC.1
MSDEKEYANKEEENCRGKCGNNYNKGREKNKRDCLTKTMTKAITRSGTCTEEYQTLHLA